MRKYVLVFKEGGSIPVDLGECANTKQAVNRACHCMGLQHDEFIGRVESGECFVSLAKAWDEPTRPIGATNPHDGSRKASESAGETSGEATQESLTMDLTPEVLKTPEGRKRVDDAVNKLNEALSSVAHRAREFVDENNEKPFSQFEVREFFKTPFAQWNEASNNLLKAMSGR